MGFLSHWAYQQAHLLNGKLYDLSLHDERTRSVAVWGRYIYSVCSYPHIVGRYKSHTGNCGIMSGEFLRHTDWIVSGTCGMRIGTLTNIWRSMGYQACAYQTGAISTTSWTPWECTRDRTLPIRFHGRLTNNFLGKVFQFWAKTSVATARGSGFQLTNSRSCDDKLLANRSKNKGPRRQLIFWNSMGESFHFNPSGQVLDSVSAIIFRAPGKCCAGLEEECCSPCTKAAGNCLAAIPTFRQVEHNLSCS